MQLNASGLKLSYKQGTDIITPLQDLSLTVATGSSVAIMGPSGVGKSTLMKVLAGLLSPQQGRVLWNDTDIIQLTEEERAQWRKKNLGILMQSPMLIPHLKAWENVSVPMEILGYPPNQAEKEAKNILKQLGLEQRVEHYPYQLSGGEAQRVSLGRALVHNPSAILADEPTGQLDPKTGDQVISMLLEQTQKRQVTVIMITHDLSVAQKCQEKYQLKEGQLSKWS